MVKSVANTNIQFFEQNTNGNIMNRFSKDVKALDQYLTIFLQMMDYLVKCFLSTVILIYLYPGLIVLAAVQTWYLLKLRHKCMCATRDTIRLKFSLMSPVNSLI